MSAHLKLFHYWRSSASWRVRIALDYKKIGCDLIAINLLTQENQTALHLARNPLGAVPALEVLESGSSKKPLFISESLAILEYLEETYPERALLPKNAIARAQARQLAETINSAIHPLQNLSTQKKLGAMGFSEDQKLEWVQFFMRRGLLVYEALLKNLNQTGPYSLGSELCVADLCLIPQLYNARRFKIDLNGLDCCLAIEQNCLSLPCFQSSHPSRYEPQAL